jgi:GNAT superfamily N-acetyltransferase
MYTYFVSLLFSLSFFYAATQGMSNGVHPYNPNRDKEAVRRVALANIKSLVTWYAVDWDKPGAAELVCDEQVVRHLNPYNTKVFLKDGQLKGFVNYSTSRLDSLWTHVVGPEGTLHHLAVDEKDRGNGYARALVEATIDECKAREVKKLSLWTNGYELESFYPKLGFSSAGRTKMHECKYVMRLQPYAMQTWLHSLVRFLRK